jgi:hypothetical protein
MKFIIYFVLLLAIALNVIKSENKLIESSNRLNKDYNEKSRKIIEIYSKAKDYPYLFNKNIFNLTKSDEIEESLIFDLFGNSWTKESFVNLNSQQIIKALESGRAMFPKSESNNIENLDEIVVSVPKCNRDNSNKINYINKVFEGVKEIINIEKIIDNSFLEEIDVCNNDEVKYKLYSLIKSYSVPKNDNKLNEVLNDYKLSSSKLENQNIDILFSENIQDKVGNIVKSNINSKSSITLRIIDDNFYTFSNINSYFTCANAVHDLKSSINKEKIDDLSKEFINKHQEFIKRNVIRQNLILENIINKPTSLKIFLLCESFQTSLQANVLNGFKSNNEAYFEIINDDCDNIIRNFLYRGLLKKKNQTYMVVNEFIEDLISSLENELINDRIVNGSLSLIEKYVEFQTKQDDINEEIQMKNEFKNIPISKRIQNNILDSRVKVIDNKLKRYNLVYEEKLIQASLVKIFSEMYGSKKILPISGGSILFEINKDSYRYSIKVFYNESLLFLDDLEAFIFKLRKKTEKEKENVLLYCALIPDYESVLNGFLIFLCFLVFTLSMFLLYCMFIKNDEDDINNNSKLELLQNLKENENCFEVGNNEIKTEESIEKYINENRQISNNDKFHLNKLNQNINIKTLKTHEDFLKTDESQPKFMNMKLNYNDNISIDISKKGSD